MANTAGSEPGTITPNQAAFIRNLCNEREHPWIEAGALTEDYINGLSKRGASEVISTLLKAPIKSRPAATTVTTATQPQQPDATAKFELRKLEDKIPAGRYFIVDPTNTSDPTSTEAGTESFFKVDKPDHGRWKGYTFLSVQASDDFYPIKDLARKGAILEEIAKNPTVAMNEYGIRLGVCGCCGRTLTRRDSRLRGMGPICAQKFISEDDLSILEQLGLV